MLLRILLPLLLVGLQVLASPPIGRAQAPGSSTTPDRSTGSQDVGSPNALAAHRTGQFDASLPIRSPLSERERWIERFQFPGDLEGWDYDLAEESFSLYVPHDYDPQGDPYGAVVWISPFGDGTIPDGLRSVFDRRRLIWIAANEAGNARHLFHRAGLALDAAANLERSYNVDPERIFVSGLSGGGRVATMAAVDFPEVFAGGFPIIGVTSYLDIPLDSNPGQRVLQFPEPAADILERAKSQPLVIMTGSGDFNREECRLTAEAYRKGGFTDVHLLDIEGMGHEMPSAEDFGRGLDWLLRATE